MKIKKCRIGNCYNREVVDTGYCEKHQGEYQKQKERIAQRLNSLPKSTLYQTTEWKRLRKEILQERGQCVGCGSRINLECHHTVRHRGDPSIFFNKELIIVLCQECHKKVSGQQIGRG